MSSLLYPISTLSQHRGTMKDPLSYANAHFLLSMETGIDPCREIKVDSMAKLRSPNGKRLAYPAHEIKVVDEAGNRHVYHDGHLRFDVKGIVPSYFIVRVPKGIEDFGHEVKFLKNAKIDDGDGWTFSAKIYIVNGITFYR